MNLKEYEQRKFALAEVIREAQAIDTKDERLLAESRDLLARIAENRFNLLIVGRFSRGKSTLMNALLGSDYLPTGIVPLTSVITTVGYGSREQVVLRFVDSGLSRDIPMSRLAEFVTQKENPGNIKKLSYAEIQLPVELLRRGVYFVDSPGLGSPIIENTATTERFLPSADAFVIVTSYESPLSEDEDRILRRIYSSNRKLFVVINKQDTVSPSERSEAAAFVTDRIAQFSFDKAPTIMSVSARVALEAKMAGDVVQLQESGIPDFESELSRFLLEEQAQSFLLNTFERTMTFLIQRFDLEDESARSQAFSKLADNLRSQRESICGPLQGETTGGGGIDTARRWSAMAEPQNGPAYTLDVDKKTGCQICGLTLEDMFRFLSTYQYELTVRPEAQREHALRGGFCQLHTWQYEGIASPQGICQGYPRLVHNRASRLSRLVEQAENWQRVLDTLRQLLPTPTTCRLCEVRIEVERHAIETVVSTINEAAGTVGGRIPSCCLTHLASVIEALGDGHTSRQLLAAHAALLERTAEDLQRSALKHDALRRYLTSEEERRASHLALLLLAGHRNLASPWVVESLL